MATATTSSRIPLNTLAIPLGLVGLAEVWSDSAEALRFPVIVAELFWIIAGVAWIWMIAAHTVRGARSAASLHSQLTHPVQGPIAALVPIVGMLLGSNLHRFWPLGGTILAGLSIAAAALFAGWILSFWMSGQLQLESIHGGYFLPTVAGSYVAAYTAATIGLRPLAIGALVVGSFFWVIMFALLIARLAFRTPLPGPLMPTLAIMMAPPAVAGGAWFALNSGKADNVAYALASLAVVMVLVQLALLPRYRKLSFSLGFWSFTFPVAYASALAIAWLHILRPIAWQGISIALLVGVTTLVVSIAGLSIALWFSGRRAAVNGAEAQLAVADNAGTSVARPKAVPVLRHVR